MRAFLARLAPCSYLRFARSGLESPGLLPSQEHNPDLGNTRTAPKGLGPLRGYDTSGNFVP